MFSNSRFVIWFSEVVKQLGIVEFSRVSSGSLIANKYFIYQGNDLSNITEKPTHIIVNGREFPFTESPFNTHRIIQTDVIPVGFRVTSTSDIIGINLKYAGGIYGNNTRSHLFQKISGVTPDTHAQKVLNIRKLTQAQYDAIANKDPGTIYLVRVAQTQEYKTYFG